MQTGRDSAVPQPPSRDGSRRSNRSRMARTRSGSLAAPACVRFRNHWTPFTLDDGYVIASSSTTTSPSRLSPELARLAPYLPACSSTRHRSRSASLTPSPARPRPAQDRPAPLPPAGLRLKRTVPAGFAGRGSGVRIPSAPQGFARRRTPRPDSQSTPRCLHRECTLARRRRARAPSLGSTVRSCGLISCFTS